MKKIINVFLVFLILVLSSMMVLGSWETYQQDLQSTGYQTLPFEIIENATIFNLSCNDGNGYQIETTDFNNNVEDKEFVIMCGSELKVIDNNLNELDIYDFGSGFINGQYELEDMDGDGFYEIILSVDYGTTSNFTIMKFNTTTESLSIHSNFAITNDQSSIRCLTFAGQKRCFINDNYKLRAFDINSTSVNDDWLNMSFGVGNDILNQPVTYADVDKDSDGDICFGIPSEDRVICIDDEKNISINITDTDLDLMNQIQLIHDNNKWFFLVGYGGARGGDGFAGLTLMDMDGDVELNFEESGTGGEYQEGGHARVWMDDIDEDGDNEFCMYGYYWETNLAPPPDSSWARIVCKENNLFETTDVDETVESSSGSLPTLLGSNVILVDLYGNEDYTGKQVIQSRGIYGFNSSLNFVKIESLNFAGSVTVDDLTGDGLAELIIVEGSYVRFFEHSEDVNNKIDFTGLGPTQSISNPVCQDEYLPFKCSYSNGCVEDDENDEFAMCIDCFDDGSHVVCTEPSGYYTFSENTLGCDLSLTNLTGYVNVTFTIWDDFGGTGAGDQNRNNTYTTSYFIAQENQSCYNITNPGEVDEIVVNTRPEFIDYPVGNAATPYCLNSVISFDCDEGICYEDADDDEIFLSVDCEGDGSYVGYGLGDTDFACFFEESGFQQMSVKVCDVYHSNCASVSWSIEVSTRTIYDVLNDGNMDCGSPYLTDDEGDFTGGTPATKPFFTNSPRTSFITDSPFCLNDLIDIECIYGLCYSVSDTSIDTSIEVDCQSDGTIDKTTAFKTNHSFTCSYSQADLAYAVYDNVTDTYDFTVSYTIRNELGQYDTTNTTITVSTNTSVCISSGAISLIAGDKYEGYNAIKKFFYSLGDDINLSGYLCAMTFIFLVSIVIGVIVSISSTITLGAIVGLTCLVLLVIIFTLAEVITWTTIILFIIISCALIAWRVIK